MELLPFLRGPSEFPPLVLYLRIQLETVGFALVGTGVVTLQAMDHDILEQEEIMTQREDDYILSLAAIAAGTKVVQRRAGKKRWGNKISRAHRRNHIARLARRTNRRKAS